MSHSHLDVYLHLVWSTKWRQPTIPLQWERDIYRIIEDEARVRHCEVLAIGGTEDHVHLLIRWGRTTSLGRLTNAMKSVSSVFLNDKIGRPEGFPTFRWQVGYGAFSVGKNNESTRNANNVHHVHRYNQHMTTPAFDPTPLRSQFPSLSLQLDGHPAVFFDNPGGTQVPQNVINAVSDYYRTANANVGGAFQTSRRTDETVAGARQAMADLLGADDPACIVFGASMTALTFHLARSFGETLRPGDEIIVTSLDHDANVAPWTDLTAQGAIIRTVDIHPEDGTLDWESFAAALTPGKTRLVAVTHASNALGTVPAMAAITQKAHAAGALVFVDAVQYVPHGPVDVKSLDCDFLVCSAYKFFGPHVGVLYGKREHLEALTPHKVRPAKNTIPYCWETGTLNHEGLAAITAAVEYLVGVGERFGSPWHAAYTTDYSGRALTLKTALRAIQEYEKTLSARLIEGLRRLGDVTIYGVTDPARFDERVPTVAFTWPRLTPRETCEYLAKFGICCWSGNYYAVKVMERLGLADDGAVRVGPAHYNTLEEIDRLLALLADVPPAR